MLDATLGFGFCSASTVVATIAPSWRRFGGGGDGADGAAAATAVGAAGGERFFVGQAAEGDVPIVVNLHLDADRVAG